MPSPLMPICLLCRHLRRDRDGLTCDAFPEGIPAAIRELRANHMRAYDGDHGIRFAAETTPDLAMAHTILRLAKLEGE